MTQIGETEHFAKPWWGRIHRVWWVIAIVVVVMMIGAAIFEKASEPAPMSYGSFLDQLDAGNVASVTFQGTAIDGASSVLWTALCQPARRNMIDSLVISPTSEIPR